MLGGLHTPAPELAAIAAGLGADVPVCLLARTAFVGGIGEDVAAVVASNVDSAESDLTAMDPKEVVVAATAAAGGGLRAGVAGVPPSPDAQERSQRLWWYLRCFGIVMLGADTLISNRMSKA